MTNSKWVTMNEAMRSGFALQYDTSIENVKAVYHAIDYPTYRNFHPLSVEIWKKHRLWEPELIVVAISRFDHARAKGNYDVAEFVRELKKFTSVQLIYVNSWSGPKAAQQVIKELKEIVPDAIFTSEFGKQYLSGVPHEVVVDLLDCANVYILPSQSETFSFTMAEAALAKNLLVINADLQPLVELMPEGVAKHVGWGANWGGTRVNRDYKPDKQLYMYDRAKEVYGEYRASRPLKAHRHAIQSFSPEAVWENQYKELIEG